MAPPSPPYRVDMRRTASRLHRNTPSTFTSSTRRTVAASCSSSRPGVLPVIPALHTTPCRTPWSAAASNSRVTSASPATSPATATAVPPAAVISATTPAAASWSPAYPTTTSCSRATCRATAAPIPRPPPVTITTPIPWNLMSTLQRGRGFQDHPPGQLHGQVPLDPPVRRRPRHPRRLRPLGPEQRPRPGERAVTPGRLGRAHDQLTRGVRGRRRQPQRRLRQVAGEDAGE